MCGRGWVCGGANIIVCVCVCVCVSMCVCVSVQKKREGGISILGEHNNYACPLACLACCCAFLRRVNILRCLENRVNICEIDINVGDSLTFNFSNINPKIKNKD